MTRLPHILLTLALVLWCSPAWAAWNAITWTDIEAGLTLSGGNLEKTGSSSWTNGNANSTSTFVNDGGCRWTIESTSKAHINGMDVAQDHNTFSTVDWAVQMASGGALYARRNGSVEGVTFDTASVSDVVAIYRDGTAVKISVNGTPLFTFADTLSAATAEYCTASLNTNGGFLNDGQIDINDTDPPVWTGAGAWTNIQSGGDAQWTNVESELTEDSPATGDLERTGASDTWTDGNAGSDVVFHGDGGYRRTIQVLLTESIFGIDVSNDHSGSSSWNTIDYAIHIDSVNDGAFSYQNGTGAVVDTSTTFSVGDILSIERDDGIVKAYVDTGSGPTLFHTFTNIDSTADMYGVVGLKTVNGTLEDGQMSLDDSDIVLTANQPYALGVTIAEANDDLFPPECYIGWYNTSEANLATSGFAETNGTVRYPATTCMQEETDESGNVFFYIPGLSLNTEYAVAVQACDSNAPTPNCTTYSASDDATATTLPQLSVTAIDPSTSVTLTWATLGLDHYELYRCSSATTCTSGTGTKVYDNTALTYTDTGATSPTTDYAWVVRGCTSGTPPTCTGPTSDSRSATAQPTDHIVIKRTESGLLDSTVNIDSTEFKQGDSWNLDGTWDGDYADCINGCGASQGGSGDGPLVRYTNANDYYQAKRENIASECSVGSYKLRIYKFTTELAASACTAEGTGDHDTIWLSIDGDGDDGSIARAAWSRATVDAQDNYPMDHLAVSLEHTIVTGFSGGLTQIEFNEALDLGYRVYKPGDEILGRNIPNNYYFVLCDTDGSTVLASGQKTGGAGTVTLTFAGGVDAMDWRGGTVEVNNTAAACSDSNTVAELPTNQIKPMDQFDFGGHIFVGPSIGEVTANSAKIRVIGDGDFTAEVETKGCSDDWPGIFHAPVAMAAIGGTTLDVAATVAQTTGLIPNECHSHRAHINGEITPEKNFTTDQPVATEGVVIFSWANCLNSGSAPFYLFNAINTKLAEFAAWAGSRLVALLYGMDGDAWYESTPDNEPDPKYFATAALILDGIITKALDAFQEPTFSTFQGSRSIVGMVDDHDGGANDFSVESNLNASLVQQYTTCYTVTTSLANCDDIVTAAKAVFGAFLGDGNSASPISGEVYNTQRKGRVLFVAPDLIWHKDYVNATDAWDTGLTVTVDTLSLGATSITGSGFGTGKAGDALKIDGWWYPILTNTGDTAITIPSPGLIAAHTSGSETIIRDFSDPGGGNPTKSMLGVVQWAALLNEVKAEVAAGGLDLIVIRSSKGMVYHRNQDTWIVNASGKGYQLELAQFLTEVCDLNNIPCIVAEGDSHMSMSSPVADPYGDGDLWHVMSTGPGVASYVRQPRNASGSDAEPLGSLANGVEDAGYFVIDTDTTAAECTEGVFFSATGTCVEFDTYGVLGVPRLNRYRRARITPPVFFNATYSEVVRLDNGFAVVKEGGSRLSVSGTADGAAYVTRPVDSTWTVNAIGSNGTDIVSVYPNVGIDIREYTVNTTTGVITAGTNYNYGGSGNRVDVGADTDGEYWFQYEVGSDPYRVWTRFCATTATCSSGVASSVSDSNRKRPFIAGTSNISGTSTAFGGWLNQGGGDTEVNFASWTDNGTSAPTYTSRTPTSTISGGYDNAWPTITSDFSNAWVAYPKTNAVGLRKWNGSTLETEDSIDVGTDTVNSPFIKYIDGTSEIIVGYINGDDQLRIWKAADTYTTGAGFSDYLTIDSSDYDFLYLDHTVDICKVDAETVVAGDSTFLLTCEFHSDKFGIDDSQQMLSIPIDVSAVAAGSWFWHQMMTAKKAANEDEYALPILTGT